MFGNEQRQKKTGTGKTLREVLARVSEAEAENIDCETHAPPPLARHVTAPGDHEVFAKQKDKDAANILPSAPSDDTVSDVVSIRIVKYPKLDNRAEPIGSNAGEADPPNPGEMPVRSPLLLDDIQQGWPDADPRPGPGLPAQRSETDRATPERVDAVPLSATGPSARHPYDQAAAGEMQANSPLARARVDPLVGREPRSLSHPEFSRPAVPKPPPIPLVARDPEANPASKFVGRHVSQRAHSEASSLPLEQDDTSRRRRLRNATSLGFGLFVAAGLSTTLGVSVLWLLQSGRDGTQHDPHVTVKVVKSVPVPTVGAAGRDAVSAQTAASLRPVPASLDLPLGLGGSREASDQPIPRLGVGRVEYRPTTGDWIVPIEVDAAGSLTGDLLVAITDLPMGAQLNRGKATADGSWFIEPDETAGLTMTLPAGSEPERVMIALVTGLGKPIAKASPRIEARPPVTLPPATPKAEADRVDTASSPFGKNHDDDSARALFEHGETRLSEGDVIGARMLFRKAAAGGDARAAIAIGATYDPNLFASMEVRGMQPDLQMARQWYRRAIELGSKDAYERLDRLGDR